MAQITKSQSDSIEVADIFREHIQDYQKKYTLLPDQYKVVYDLLWKLS